MSADFSATLMTSASIRAAVNQVGGQIESTAPVTLKTSTSQSRLDQLYDVIEGSPVDGATLVYRASDDKYLVQQLSLQNVTGALDGGTF